MLCLLSSRLELRLAKNKLVIFEIGGRHAFVNNPIFSEESAYAYGNVVDNEPIVCFSFQKIVPVRSLISVFRDQIFSRILIVICKIDDCSS